MSITANKNFPSYFLFVFATIPLSGVFYLDVGGKIPSGRYAAKSKSHAFSHWFFSIVQISTSNGGHPIQNSTLLVSTSLSSLFLLNVIIPSHKSGLLILRSYFTFPLPRSYYPTRNTIAACTHSCHTKLEISLPFSTQRNISAYLSQLEFQSRYQVALNLLDFAPSIQHVHAVIRQRLWYIAWADINVTIFCFKFRLVYCVNVNIYELQQNNITSALFDEKFRSPFDTLTTLFAYLPRKPIPFARANQHHPYKHLKCK